MNVNNKVLFESVFYYVEKKYNVKNMIDKIVSSWNCSCSVGKTTKTIPQDVLDELETGMQDGICRFKNCLQDLIKGSSISPLEKFIAEIFEDANIDLINGEILDFPVFFVLSSSSYIFLSKRKIGVDLLQHIDVLFKKKGIII